MNGKPKREKRVELRLNDLEYQALKKCADAKGMAVAEFLRDYVKTLVTD
jgi:predicted DNA binding CopG/RHH family protein